MSQQINLFNPIFLKQKKYFSALAMVEALGLIVLGSLVLFFYANYELSNLRAQGAATSKQLKTVQEQLVKISTTSGVRQKSKALEEELLKLEAEVKSLQTVSSVLQKGELGNTKGYAEYMRALSRQIVNGLWLTGFDISGAGNEIELHGRALQPELIPAYIGLLRREPVMRGKSFTTLEMQVPQVEQVSKSVPPAPAKRVPAEYIEFKLRSILP